MLQYIFGAGAAVGLAVGYKMGHAVGSRAPQRQIEKVGKFLKKTKDKIANKFNEITKGE